MKSATSNYLNTLIYVEQGVSGKVPALQGEHFSNLNERMDSGDSLVVDTLQAQGRKVGVISHVQEMTERIGVRIQVKRQSGGQNRVVVV